MPQSSFSRSGNGGARAGREGGGLSGGRHPGQPIRTSGNAISIAGCAPVTARRNLTCNSQWALIFAQPGVGARELAGNSPGTRDRHSKRQRAPRGRASKYERRQVPRELHGGEIRLHGSRPRITIIGRKRAKLGTRQLIKMDFDSAIKSFFPFFPSAADCPIVKETTTSFYYARGIIAEKRKSHSIPFQGNALRTSTKRGCARARLLPTVPNLRSAKQAVSVAR